MGGKERRERMYLRTAEVEGVGQEPKPARVRNFEDHTSDTPLDQ